MTPRLKIFSQDVKQSLKNKNNSKHVWITYWGRQVLARLPVSVERYLNSTSTSLHNPESYHEEGLTVVLQVTVSSQSLGVDTWAQLQWPLCAQLTLESSISLSVRDVSSSHARLFNLLQSLLYKSYPIALTSIWFNCPPRGLRSCVEMHRTWNSTCKLEAVIPGPALLNLWLLSMSGHPSEKGTINISMGQFRTP